MVCSNQSRQTLNEFGPKYKSPGGEAMPFYSSLRLKTEMIKKIKVEKTMAGKDVSRIVGIRINVNVFGSSVWKPYRTVPVTVIFDYGIDDIKENLQFIKDYTKNTTYCLGNSNLSSEMNKSIQMVEEAGLEMELKNEVIDLWEKIERKFDSNRKTKIR